MAINASSGGQLQGGSNGPGSGGGLTEEDVQDIVASQIEVGTDISIGLQTSYDDTTGKLMISLAGAGSGSSGGAGSIGIKEDGTARGTATILNFVGPGVDVVDNVATITGGLDSITVYENTSNRGNFTNINFVSGATVNVVDGTANIVIDPSTGYMTTEQIQNAISTAIAPLASTAYVATQIANIPPVNLSNYATTSYVNTQINSVLDGAPAALNTLKEIATALGNNATFADSIAASVATKASQSYVDTQLATKVTQYELTAATSSTASTLTNYINSAIAGIPAYSLPTASVSTLGGVKVGTGLAINSQGVLNVTFTPTTSLPWSSITDKPALFSGSYTDLTNKPALFSGSYNDLTNKPTIPSLAGYATEAYVNQKLNSLNLEDLTDTYVTGVTDGQALVWSQANLRWQPGSVSSGGGGGSYTLPTATTSLLGGVKVDGTTITISNGVISAVGGGSGGGVTLSDVGTYLNNNGYATQTYVNNQISNIVDGAPTLLNTLNELAAALADNPNFAADVLLKTGGTMTGALTLSGAPVSNLDAATKGYVDQKVSLGLSSLPSSVSRLDELIDVDTSSATAGQVLSWNGTSWVAVNNSGAKGDTGAQGPQGPQGLSISAATVTLAGRLQLTLSNNSIVDAGNVSGIKTAAVNGSGELILTKQDNSTINAGSVIGPQGSTGATGAQGIKGDTGSQGPAGLSVSGAAVNGSGRLIITRSDSSIIDAGLVIGPKGDTGATGAKGDTGSVGPAGANGTNGVGVSSAVVSGSGRLIITKTDNSTIDAGNVVGPKGDQGITGNTGATGAKGDRGVSVFQAVVDGDGNLQITLDDASQLDAGSVIGPQGAQGVQGPAGRSIASSGVVVDSAGNLQITLTDGVTINAGHVVGPQGSTGATGATGAQGPKGDTGATGATGATGTSYTVNGSSGSVQIYGLSSATQPGFNFEVDLSNKANRLTTARTISLTGKVTGLTSFDGSGNVSITTALNNVSTSDITEGTRLYYTDARSRLALSSISDSNITSLISYDDTTGQIKYRANTSYITEGSNLYFTNTRADARADVRIGASSINALADVDTVTTAPTNGQVLTWTGSAWTPSSVSGGSGAVLSVNSKTGTVVLSTDDVAEGTSNLYYTNSRWDTRLATKTTDNLNEGATNKYFSNTLARNALAAGTGLSYNSSTGTFSLNTSTDNVTEGSSNLYYTSTRFDTRLGQSNLSQLADVTGTTPTTGQALAWNGSAWTPTTISSGGGGGGSSSGIFRAAVQVEYDASGNLTSANVLNGGISAVIATATSTTATVTFTFTGSVCAPLNIQVYGYQRASNLFVTRGIGSDYSARTLAGGGSSGSPSAFSAFDASANTMTLSLTKALTGATAAVGQTTHCVVQFLLSS
jgi:hypothetical protein